MKKFLSLILALTMIMSTLVIVTVVPAVAAEPTLQPAKTWTLNASNWLDDDVFTLASTTLGGWSNVFDGKYTEADGVIEATNLVDGTTLYAADGTKVYEVKDGKLHTFSYAASAAEGTKPVIVFTAPSYGTYTFGYTAHINGGGAAEINGWRASNTWDECQVKLTWTEEGENAGSATFVSTHESDKGATTITLAPGQKIAVSVAANALAPTGYVDVDMTVTVTFNGSEGKAFNFVSNGSDNHGTNFGLYGTASAGVSDLVELKVTGAQAGTHSFTGEAGTGYYPADGTELTWALDQGGKLVVPAPLGTGTYENSAVVVKFTAPEDGTYSLNVDGALWGGANYAHAVQLWGDNGRIRSVKLPDNTAAPTDFGKVTLVKGESAYIRFCGLGAGFTINGITATYVAASETDIGYTASILPEAQQTIGYETNVNVKLNVNKTEAATITNFAAAEFKLTYDKTYFTFDAASSVLGTAQYKIVEGENNINTLIVEDYGTTKAFGDAYTLAFKGIKATEGADPATVAITLTEAGFSRAVDAEKADLTPATLVNTAVNVQINKQRFDVTLDPVDHFSTSGEAIIGESFTITEKNAANYNYNNVVITMNGVTLTEEDYTYANNQYVIEAVTGPITVTATVTEKVYNVGITGTTESNDGTTATYNTNYSFTIPEDTEKTDVVDGHYFTVHNLSIGSTAIIVNGVVQDGVGAILTNEGRTYTIAGSFINGDITIEIKEDVQLADNVHLVIDGQSGAITGAPEQIKKGEDFTFSINNPTDGYDYTVSYKVGETDMGTLTPDENGVYTIPGDEITASVTVTVTATMKVDAEVVEFLTLNGTAMWLVLNRVEKLENSTHYAIWGSTISGIKDMFWSDKYQAYCYLVVATEAPDASEFSFKIVNGAATEVHAQGESDLTKYDVNLTGKVDINDAQLVYNMYETKAYTNFSDNVTVEKFLRADINDTTGINVDDARAIVTYILG